MKMAQNGFMQPGAGFASPVLGPDIAQKQYQLAQRQAYAQALMQQGMEPLQGQNVGGHYVAPSWTQGLAKALGGYLGMKAMADMPQQQQELQQMQADRMAAQFGLGQPQAPQDAQSMPVGQTANQPTMPLLPGRSAQESFIIAQGMGLPAYLKMVGEQGNQRPVAVAPGGTLVDPRTNQPVFTAAQNGIQMAYGPDGAQAQAVPGYGAANAQIQGAEAGAIAAARHPFEIAQNRDSQQTGAMLDLVDVPDGRGGTIKMPRAQAAQMLGAGQPAAQSAPSGLGTTVSPRVQEARQMLPKIDTQVSTMVNTIDQILNHKGLDYSVGVWGKAPTIPGTPQADVRALQDQIQGQAFLQAFESLKGGGAITEVEGKKAEQAIARLQSTQSAPAYRAALTELKDMLQSAQERAYKSADMPRPGSAPSVAAPKNAQDFQALPSGTLFRAPDGSIRRKP
jgi:hypothetical protein